MRDAVGGTFMIRVFLIFLATYIIFIGIAMNYAKAFRVKNKLIDIIEQNEGIMDFNSDNALDKIGTYLNKMHYGSNFGDNIDESNCNANVSDIYDEVYYYNSSKQGNGYCIAVNHVDSIDDDYDIEYYQVVTFVVIKIPFLWREPIATIPIKGETRRIERIK